MRGKRFTEDKIIGVLKEAEAGAKIIDVCRRHGISDATYYNWKTKYAGMQRSDIKRLKEVEEENRKLKRIVADQQLEITAMKDIVSKNW
jgi:putative transposase